MKHLRQAFAFLILIYSLGASAQTDSLYRVFYEFEGLEGETPLTQVEVIFNDHGVVRARAFHYDRRFKFRQVQALSAQLTRAIDDGTFNLVFEPTERFKLQSLHLDPRVRVHTASAIYTDTCSLNMRDFKERRIGKTLFYGRTSAITL